MKAKKLFHVASVLALGLALASCGSDNKSNGVSGVSGFSNISGNAANQVNNLRGSYPCAYGQPTVQSFTTYVGGQVNGTRTYVGMQMSQTFPDIIIVQVSGSQATVQVSMCPLQGGQQIQFVNQPNFSSMILGGNGAEGTMSFYYQNNYYGAVSGASYFTGQGTY